MPECTCKQGDPSTETPRYMYIGDGIVLVEGPLEKIKDHLDEIKKVLRESFEKEMEERSKRKK